MQHPAPSGTGRAKEPFADSPGQAERPAGQDGAARHSPSPSARKESPSRCNRPPPLTGPSLQPASRAHQPRSPREGAGHGRGDAHGQHLCSSSSGASSAAAASRLTGTKWPSCGKVKAVSPRDPDVPPLASPPDANLPGWGWGVNYFLPLSIIFRF